MGRPLSFISTFADIMWDKIATFILKQRTLFLIAILAFTGIMGYYATKVQLEYQLQRLAPKTIQILSPTTNSKKLLGWTTTKWLSDSQPISCSS